MMKTHSAWSRIAETAACHLRNGWLLIPVTVGVTIAVQRIGLAASCLVVLVLSGVHLARRYRITISRKRND